MKKQLLFVPLVGLLCFTSCNKSRELTPVDDKTGLDRATAILEKEKEIAEEVTTNPANFFKYFPNKFTLTVKGTENGKARIFNSSMQIFETTMDNVTTTDIKIEVNRDALQFHMYEYDAPLYAEYNSFYDEAKGIYYSLTKPFYGTKIKISTKVTNREEAEACFYESVELLGSFADYFLPIDYLTRITEKDENNDYKLLETYKKIQTEYFDRFGNDDEYLKHQFGSNDKNSFSLRNDLKIHACYLPILELEEIIANGYMEGAGSAYYNDALQSALGNYVFIYGDTELVVPDLIVFEDNYLSYALFNSTIDAKSDAQLGMPKGALYQHTTQKTEISFVKNIANITNPNPDDYKEVE